MRKHIGDIVLFVSALALTAFIAFLASNAYGAEEEIVPVAPSQTYTFETNVKEARLAAEAKVEEPVLISLGKFTITHYCPCKKCCGKSDGITATGTKAVPGQTIAVDPSIIPFGSKVILKYEDGTTDDYIAEDRGGAIKGNRVDVFMGQHKAALHAGVRYAEVFLVGESV